MRGKCVRRDLCEEGIVPSLIMNRVVFASVPVLFYGCLRSRRRCNPPALPVAGRLQTTMCHGALFAVVAVVVVKVEPEVKAQMNDEVDGRS